MTWIECGSNVLKCLTGKSPERASAAGVPAAFCIDARLLEL